MNLVALSLALLALPLSAAPRLHVSTATIEPDTTFELVLDQQACPADQVGKEAQENWLTIEPAWAGTVRWKEANVLEFLPTAAPQMETTYVFGVAEGRTHLDGSPVPAGPIASRKTPLPGIDYATMIGRYDDDWSPRTARYFLAFNGPVTLVDAAPFFHYIDKEGQRMAARVRRPRFAELKQPGHVRPTFEERWQAKLSGQAYQPDLEDPATFANFLIVEPAAALPLGDEWYLVAEAGLPIGAHTLDKDSRRRIGDVDPFAFQSIEARTEANVPRRIILDFTRDLPKDVAQEMIRVEPRVPGVKLVSDEDQLEIHGDLSGQDEWTVVIEGGLSSYDGLMLGKRVVKKVTFRRLDPGLALMSHDEGQLAAGNRLYRISTVNLDSLRVRIKQLGGRQLIRAQQGYRYYTGRGPNGRSLRPQRLMPYEMMAGRTIADFEVPLDNAIDTSRELWIDWDEVLAGKAAPYRIGSPPEGPRDSLSSGPGAFFIEVVGAPKEDAGSSRSKVAQSLVQLSDLGLAWKVEAEEMQVFVYSCRSGEPLEGVRIGWFGEDAAALGEVETDARGLATLPRDPATRHLRASLGRDQFTTACDDVLPTISLWRFPVRYSWDPSPLNRRRVMLFSDRSLYRPGEEVHVKALVRQQRGNLIDTQASTEKVRLSVVSPTGIEILSEELEVSAAGSLDHSFRLPAETTGPHFVHFTWPEEYEAANELDDWSERAWAMDQSRFSLMLRVEEFRRNAFEIGHELTRPAPGAEKVELAVSASNYNGQPLDGAEVYVWSQVSDRNFYPDRFRDHLFGDHRQPDHGYWSHYFGYSWGDGGGNRRSDSETSELKLDEQGKVVVRAKVPEAEFPTLQEVQVQTEVTDSNRQTLTRTSSVQVHPSSVYLGVSRLDRLVRVGDEIPLELLAVDVAGERFGGDLELRAKVSREVNEQVRMRTAAGVAVRNETREEVLSTREVSLPGGETDFTFAPTQPGKHTLEFRGSDAAGRPFATAIVIHVYGSDAFPWAYEDNMRIRLVPEKTLYRPGDTARILVLSPIEGTALVTVEREGVSRAFTMRLDATEPVIELPLSDADAPNCYVSVLVIKGSEASRRTFKEPQLRLGYCELMVENQRDRLQVEIGEIDGALSADPVAGQPVSLLPGTEVAVVGRVLDATGAPAAGAEVTVYAEDEGTLAVIGYDTPDPMAFFYDPRELRVRCGTSLGKFVSEAPDDQTFYNKGLFIGGGGEPDAADFDLMRRDFNPCAFWMPTVVTDAEGRFRIEADLPDTLTRYRLIAVAHQQGARFGHCEEEFRVNKPLMLEPQKPRFANEGDRLAMRATIRNASNRAGQWRVRLVPNPPASEPIAVLAAGVQAETQVNLAAGEATTVRFDVDFRNTGEAVMTWRAEPVKLAGRAPTAVERRRHADAVEAVFPVEYPVPLMRQTRLVRIDRESSALDLLEGLNPNLLGGRGRIELETSRSLLLEAGGAVDHLLTYPYGCLEQTTSSLMPWLAVERLRAASPALARKEPTEVRRAIRKGVQRLLSMQNSNGGFGYWPGDRRSLRWASSYAGLGLIMASEQVEVPDGALERLGDYLIRGLREIDEGTTVHELETAACDLWVLALQGRPQESYTDLLRQRMPQLTTRARAFLALAETTAGRQQVARQILAAAAPVPERGSWWMRWQPDDAMKLLAWSAIDRESAEAVAALDKMLRDRNPYGHWRTTWVNSWSLLALAAYAGDEELTPTRLVIQTGGEAENVTVDADRPVDTRSFALHPSLKLQVSADGPAFVRVKLAAKPEIAPLQPVASNGMEVTRFYRRMHPDGTSEPLDVPQVGDLVRVEMRVTLPDDDARYLVVEDRLPGTFEAVNNSFASQAANLQAGNTSERSWSVSHHEIRADRVMFFLDRPSRRGTHTLSYLARVTMEGRAYAPPAKVEAMYDPERLALSASRRFDVD
jgi:uncharacterized protein YfaS (alpha-2-macroglobulin family)